MGDGDVDIEGDCGGVRGAAGAVHGDGAKS